MYETGSPVHNLSNSLTAPMARLLNAVKHLDGDDTYVLQVRLGISEIVRYIDQFAIEVKEIKNEETNIDNPDDIGNIPGSGGLNAT